MPTYTYLCRNNACKKHNEEYNCILSMDRHKEPQPCPECGTKHEKVFRPTTNFILKGDGWAGKNHRIANQMREKNKRLDARTNEMKRDAPNVALAPNVDGERVDSWAEAQKLAKSKGKNTDSYEPHIAKEKENKK